MHHAAHRFLRGLCGLQMASLVFCTLAAANAAAQTAPKDYPQKPIRLVVPFPAGGPSDVVARVVGQRMSESLHQTIFIDNRPGANTIIGADAVAKSAADGYTLLLAIDNTLVMNQFLYAKLPYDPIKDLEPIGKVAVSPLIVITNAKGPKTLGELVSEVKADPKKVSYGFGTFTTQLSGELMKRVLGKGMVDVTYKGSTGTTQGLLSDDVTFTIDGVTAALPHIQKGTFNALAKLSDTQIPALPSLRTLTESGVPMPNIEVWFGLMAPHGTPPAIVARLNHEMRQALAAQDVQDKLTASGVIADGSSPEALKAYITSEAAKWKPVIDEAGIKIE